MIDLEIEFCFGRIERTSRVSWSWYSTTNGMDKVRYSIPFFAYHISSK